jgi:hypothetical protein
MISDAVERFARGGDLHEGKAVQNAEDSGYYTFPTEDELAICKEKGIRLVNGEEMRELLAGFFAEKGNEDELRDVIGKAAEIWYREYRSLKVFGFVCLTYRAFYRNHAISVYGTGNAGKPLLLV